MEMIADILLAAGAIGAGIYCFVLGRRLKRFNDLEKGVGGAVAVLSAQVDDLTKTLAAAQTTAHGSTDVLNELTSRAEQMSKQLELQLASLHDLPVPETAPSVARDTSPHGGLQVAPMQQSPSEPLFVRHRTTEAQS
ncbi:MAG: hypothetical protein AAF636_20905 [Pseudomonadota bacterium]